MFVMLTPRAAGHSYTLATPTVNPAPNPVDAVDARVRVQQVALIYQQAPLAVVITLVVAGLIGVMLWDLTDRWRLLAWLALALCIALARLALVLWWKRRPDARSLESWERLLRRLARGHRARVGRRRRSDHAPAVGGASGRGLFLPDRHGGRRR
jgi:MFS family permease